MRLAALLPVVLSVAATIRPAIAREEAPAASEAPASEEEEERPLKVHGFLLGAASVRTTGEEPLRGHGGDFALGEGRLRLEVGGASDTGAASFLVKGDAFHDAVTRALGVDLREAYAAATPGPLDLRLGRQIVTWGVGDLFFVNDVFPKDWDSFFSGRPMEYLKLGADGLRTRFSSETVNAEFVAVPFFTPDTLPSAERFPLRDPYSRAPRRREEEPASRFSNTELALRLYRRVEEADVSLYAHRGFSRMPGVRFDDPVSPTVATRFFPGLSAYGASAQRSLLGGIASLEAGYHDSREDRRGTDPAIPNSQWRGLCGYQFQPWEDGTVGLQAYGEVTADYGAYRDSLLPGSPGESRFRKVLSARMTQSLEYQTWTLSLFAAYSPSDGDYFVRPEISYKVTDDLGVSLGANVFGGRRKSSFFGQLDGSDNVFLNVRYDF